jgi:Tetratricopeptide repeat
LHYSNEGKYAKATEFYNQVLEVQKRELGLEHPDTLGSMANLAADYSRDSARD